MDISASVLLDTLGKDLISYCGNGDTLSRLSRKTEIDLEHLRNYSDPAAVMSAFKRMDESIVRLFKRCAVYDGLVEKYHEYQSKVIEDAIRDLEALDSESGVDSGESGDEDMAGEPVKSYVADGGRRGMPVKTPVGELPLYKGAKQANGPLRKLASKMLLDAFDSPDAYRAYLAKNGILFSNDACFEDYFNRVAVYGFPGPVRPRKSKKKKQSSS